MSYNELANLHTRQYLPATLKHNGIGWFIEYYSINPQSKELERVRVKLNRERKRFATNANFKIYANQIICELNNKLAGGWSPFFSVNENARLYTPLSVVMKDYIAEKTNELRSATLTSYKSWCKMFGDWCDEITPNIYMSMFNRVLAVRYLDYVLKVRKVSARTWNNHLKMGRAFFSWAKEKCYVNENPFELIKTKREQEKKRVMIPADYREQITDFLVKNNREFLTVCRLVFISLIRPKEIREIKIKHIKIKEKAIFIPSENAKTHNARYAAINGQILDDLLRLQLDKYPQDYYLFGENLTPSIEQCGEARFRKEWLKVRCECNLPAEMQLYSLRDTGINNLLKKGIDPLTVMQHADHHDLAMTTRYANHHDEHLTDTIFNNAVDF